MFFGKKSIESPNCTVKGNELPNHTEMKHCYSGDTVFQTESPGVPFVPLKPTA